MRSLLVTLSFSATVLFFTSCDRPVTSIDADAFTDEQITAELNLEIAKIMEVYAKASVNPEAGDYNRFVDVLREFDTKYNSNLAQDFEQDVNSKLAKKSLGSGDFPPLDDLPLVNDGDVYLSGGNDDAVGTIIDWVAPNVTSGRYCHGASFDKDKFDPSNLESACFHTAVEKGAGFESAMDWMTKANVSVMHYNGSLDATALNTSQTSMDGYCDPSNTNMQYGFFRNVADIFSIVSKSDNYNWYCTKMAWRIYNNLGIDLDSNSPQINWTTSGLYSIVVAYYKVKYWYSKSKANAAISQYMSNARSTLVLAEEIYFSPLMSRVYEVIRN